MKYLTLFLLALLTNLTLPGQNLCDSLSLDLVDWFNQSQPCYSTGVIAVRARGVMRPTDTFSYNAVLIVTCDDGTPLDSSAFLSHDVTGLTTLRRFDPTRGIFVCNGRLASGAVGMGISFIPPNPPKALSIRWFVRIFLPGDTCDKLLTWTYNPCSLLSYTDRFNEQREGLEPVFGSVRLTTIGGRSLITFENVDLSTWRELFADLRIPFGVYAVILENDRFSHSFLIRIVN